MRVDTNFKLFNKKKNSVSTCIQCLHNLIVTSVTTIEFSNY